MPAPWEDAAAIPPPVAAAAPTPAAPKPKKAAPAGEHTAREAAPKAPRGAVLKGRAIADAPVPIAQLAEDSGVMDRPAARNMFDRLMRSHGPFRFHSGSDRSVQAHINEVVRLCRQAVADNDGDLPDNYEQAGEFDVFLNQSIRRVKSGDYFVPADAWLSACLRDFADFDAEALAQLGQHRRAQRQQAMAEQLLQAAKDRGLSPDDPAYVQMVQWLEHAKERL